MHGAVLLGLLPTIAKSCRLSASFLLCACASNVQQVTVCERLTFVENLKTRTRRVLRLIMQIACGAKTASVSTCGNSRSVHP